MDSVSSIPICQSIMCVFVVFLSVICCYGSCRLILMNGRINNNNNVVCRQELGDVLTIAASPDGKFVYTSCSDGQLYCIDASIRAVVAEWKPEDVEPATLTSLSTSVFSNDVCLITAVDNSGLCSIRLCFCH